jgi:hypothetical protein
MSFSQYQIGLSPPEAQGKVLPDRQKKLAESGILDVWNKLYRKICSFILTGRNASMEGVAMKNPPGSDLIRYLLLAPALLLVTTTAIFAQVDPERIRTQEMVRREWKLRNSGKEPKNDPNDREVKAIAAQIEQDFNRILIRHNEIAALISSDKHIDNHYVSEATAEIKKRASHLQGILALRETESEQPNSQSPQEFNEVQVKEALFTLCKQIKGFVTNPVIENPGTVNADQLAKAKKDLESLIQLSGHISKDAEKLSKNHK